MSRRAALGSPFRRLWWAGAISGTGDGMFLTAFPLLAASLTRDPFAVAGVTLATRLPWLLFSLPAGAVADRVDRRRLMVVADVARTLVVAALGVAVAVAHPHMLWLYACAFGLGAGETVHANASQAILPTLVSREGLTTANARLTSAQVVTETFAGPPAGSALFAVAPAVPFLADGVSFAAAAVLVSGLPQGGPQPATESLWADIREGVGHLWGHVVLRRLVLLLGALNFFYFATEAVLVLYTYERLHAGKAVYTALFVAAATGTVATQWMVAPLQRRVGSAATITISLWLWALSLVGLALTRSPAVAIVCFLLLGMGDGLWRVLTVTLRQLLTPNRLMGRVNAAYRMVAQGVIAPAAAFGGALARAFGIRAPFVAAAAVFVVIAMIGPALLRPVGPLAASTEPTHG